MFWDYWVNLDCLRQFWGCFGVILRYFGVIGVILGAVFGTKIAGVKIIGDIFLRLIQMAVIPLVFCTVIAAIGKLPIKRLGRLGVKTAAWFMGTTFIAALVGLVLGWWF